MSEKRKPTLTRRTKPPAQINQSVRDSIECLLEIASLEQPIGSRELARRLNQNHTRINRIISTLSYMGLTDQTADRKYIAGTGLLVLASLSLRSFPVYRCAMSHLEELGKQTGYQVALGLRWRTNITYLYHGHTQEHAALGIAAEGLYPAESSSIGLVLMAQLSNEEIAQLYSHAIDTDMNVLFERVEQTRRNGFAIAPNARSIAMPLGEPAIAGIALYHTEEQDELPQQSEYIQELTLHLQNTVDNILAEMRCKRIY